MNCPNPIILVRVCGIGLQKTYTIQIIFMCLNIKWQDYTSVLVKNMCNIMEIGSQNS